MLSTARAADVAAGDFTFVQISDSHIGFNKEANPDVVGTLKLAVAKIKALPKRPDLIIHTGDLSHLFDYLGCRQVCVMSWLAKMQRLFR
jgi:3',5'-cyclic-AMP phosphodiesterase